VDLAKVLLQFFRFECCAKCTPCRTGTRRMYQIMDEIVSGHGTLEGLDELQSLGQDMELLSNCGLGQTASVAVRDILKHFRPEIEEHITDHVCRAGVCWAVDSTAGGSTSPVSQISQGASELQAGAWRQ
jgi:NADP-reducing hydrogenase subunit HndC